MDSASATQSQVLCHPGLSSQLATKAGIASRRKGESPDPLSNDFFKGNNTVQKQPSTNKVDSRDIIAP
ncbi:hypothetical protein HG530_012943 [Fusarium avenaceum]|nr:hypothetical protein HG530_012943 [Fusarium avenaceum]